MQKQKLIYILHDLIPGGVETALLSAIPRLAEEFDLRIVCIGKIDNKFSECLDKDIKKRVVSFNYSLILLPLAMLKAIRFIIKKKPNIIIASLWKASFVATICKKLTPRIIFISFIHSNKFFSKLDSISTKIAIKQCNAIFCDSQASSLFISKYTQKIPIIISFLRFPTPKENRIKEKLNLNAVFLGRVSNAKRIDNLLQLIYQLKQKGILFYLDIIGRDAENLRCRLELQVNELSLQNQVNFKEEISPAHVQEILQQYDFYMQTSDNEGMAMTVVEAMQLGLVPIVTPVGEIKNYTQDMYNAIHVPLKPSDYTSCVEKIMKVVNNIQLYNELSENAHKTFLGKPEYKESLVAEIENVIENNKLNENS